MKMTHNKGRMALAMLLGIGLAQPALAEGAFKVIYRFTGNADGYAPGAGPAISSGLVLFGTTGFGGKS